MVLSIVLCSQGDTRTIILTGHRTFIPICLAAVCIVGMEKSLLYSEIIFTFVDATGVSDCPNSVALHLVRYAILERHFPPSFHSYNWSFEDMAPKLSAFFFAPLALVSCHRQLARSPRGMVECRNHLLRSGPRASVGYRRIIRVSRTCNRHGDAIIHEIIFSSPSPVEGQFNVRVIFPIPSMKKRQNRKKNLQLRNKAEISTHIRVKAVPRARLW